MSHLSNPKFELTNAEESVLSSLGLLNDTPNGSALVKEDGLIKNRVMSSGSSITLKTDGVDNGSQSILNLKAGTNLNLTDDGLGGITIDAIGDGMGDVTGPVSSTNNNVVLFNGTTGKIIKDSGLQLAGSNTGDVTVTDSSEIDFTLTGQNITGSLKTGSIDETKLDTSVNTSLGLANTSVQPAGLTNYFNKTVDDTDDITTGAVNKFATSAEKTKLGFISVTQAVDLDAIETNSNASKVKTDFITVTQAVNLDTIESDTVINNAKVSNATHTGDATGSTALTLATVNSNIGSFGLASSVGQFVVNAKGLITSAVNVAISITASQVSDFANSVRSTILTGISFATSTAVTATDSILIAIGKLQAQNTAQDTVIASKVQSITAGTNITLGGTATNPIINATGGGSSYTFTNGLNEVAGVVKLQGTLTEATNISQGGFGFDISENANHGLFLSPTGGANELKSDSNASLVADAVAKVQGATGLEVVTPGVIATTATAGQVLTLVNASTGEAEYQTVSGGGGLTLSTEEIDIGAKLRKSGKFTIASSGLTVGKPVLIQQSSGPYTGKGTLADEAEMDGLIINAYVKSGTEIQCFWNSKSFVKGNFKFNYQVSL